MKYGSRMLAGWLGGMLTVIGLSGGGAAQAVTQNTALMQAIAREIAQSDELAGIDWVEVTAVFGVDGDGDVNESYGYAYDRAGPTPWPFWKTPSSAKCGATASGCGRRRTRASSRCLSLIHI